MKVAVQGCSHGSLDEIYKTIETYTETTSEVVDLLLLCGDFQALRSKHDFASLAVPPKYFALGSFHEYYSGKKVAPVLTLVIGGNHEASNYMWELYHGGWLAPNIYYLGNTGCVQVDGLRVVGMSGIYKSNDYNKGHFEKMPLDRSTMRSIYHIRHYDILKVKQLPVTSPTIALSHDWPCSIYYHGDTKRLLRNKPFFEQEIKTDTLGSPPLLEVLKILKPDFWFSAHLHVKFAAIYDHDDGHIRPMEPNLVARSTMSAVKSVNPDEIAIGDNDDDDNVTPPTVVAPVANPDEIDIGDDEDDVGNLSTDGGRENPDEIAFDDDEEQIVYAAENDKSAASGLSTDATGPETTMNDLPPPQEARQALEMDESVDLVEAVRKGEEGPTARSHEVLEASVKSGGESQSQQQQHQQLDQTTTDAGPSGLTGRQTRFLALDKVLPGRDFIQFLDIPTPQPTVNHRPRMTFDAHWLAITRALHPYLTLNVRQLDPPYADLEQLISTELERLNTEGLLVPEVPKPGEESSPIPDLVWERGPVDIDRVQKFWPTAPAHGEPGGSDHAWYTNPQTEAFCGMLGIENKINPRPA